MVGKKSIGFTCWWAPVVARQEAEYEFMMSYNIRSATVLRKREECWLGTMWEVSFTRLQA